MFFSFKVIVLGCPYYSYSMHVSTACTFIKSALSSPNLDSCFSIKKIRKWNTMTCKGDIWKHELMEVSFVPKLNLKIQVSKFVHILIETCIRCNLKVIIGQQPG